MKFGEHDALTGDATRAPAVIPKNVLVRLGAGTRRRGRYVPGRRRELEDQLLEQAEEGLKLIVHEMFGTQPEQVVDKGLSLQVAAVAEAGAGTVFAGVLFTGLRRVLCMEDK